MPFVDVGAFIGGQLVPSKKVLKDTVRSEPHRVTFYGTSALGPQYSWPMYADGIPEGVTLSVCGPNPLKDRRWYASVSLKKGKPVVS